MGIFKETFWKVLAWVFFCSFGHETLAQEAADLRSAIEIDLRLIEQLDQFNLHVSEGYVDCLCLFIKERGAQDPRCQGRGENPSYIQTKINHAGQLVSETKICSAVIEKLQQRVTKVSTSIRVKLALIRAYENLVSNGAFQLQIERPSNREQFRKYLQSRRISHLLSFEGQVMDLEPLQAVEVEAALTQHFSTAEEIRNRFVESNAYKMAFQGLDLREALEFLRTDRAATLRAPSTEILKEHYRKFAMAERSEMLISLKRDYERELNSLPVLIYLRSPSPQPKELLTAQLQVNENARERAGDSRKALFSFETEREANSEKVVSEFALVMDHGLGRLYLPVMLRTQLGWSDEKATEVISRLAMLRSQQKLREKILQGGTSAGAAVICFLPHPGARLISMGAKILLRNFCLLGASGGLNTYYLLESHSKYLEKASSFLSTPDGWNQVTKLNQVLEEKSEVRTWLLFYAFELMPAHQILKVLGHF